jgi:hypothetical protein
MKGVVVAIHSVRTCEKVSVLTVLPTGRWMSGPRAIRPARPFPETHQVVPRVAAVGGAISEEAPGQGQGS